jgi:lipopolysaccharide export system permease protein
MSLIDRHILRTFIPPFFFGLVVTTFILMIDILQKYVDLFLGKGISLRLASEVLLLSLGHIFALTVPMAILIGVLMAVGHLAADSEITALKATGVSLYRVALPLILVGLLTGAVMVGYNHFVLPRTNLRLTGLLIDIHHKRPTFAIRENAFVKIDDEYTIFVRHKDDRTGRLEDVILVQREGRGDTHPDLIVAKWGQLTTKTPGRIELDLFSGEYHSLPDRQDLDLYHRTAFERQKVMIVLNDDFTFGENQVRKNDRSMDLRELKTEQRSEYKLYQKSIEESHELVAQALEPILGLAQNARVEKPGTAGSQLDERRRLANDFDRKARALAVKAQVSRSHLNRSGRYAVEYHKKFAIPGACLVFVLLGVPLAVTTSRGGRGVSIGLSLAAYIVYYLFLSGGEKLADRGFLSPWVAMWAANLVLGPLGILILYQSVQETRIVELRLPTRIKRLWKRTA